jgi:C-terminal processing protease CtpA/Prc
MRSCLCDEHTGSDGEAFTEGFKRLGLGKVIGTRTWGGEIWLSFNTWLSDKGIATAAEDGVYGPEGKWLIEGHGVDPDIVVDNLPHSTFNGEDAQLKAAISNLQEQIRLQPWSPCRRTRPIRTRRNLDNAAIWNSIKRSKQLTLIAGPCVIENEAVCRQVARSLRKTCRAWA